MLKVIAYLALAAVLLLGGVVAYAATRPDHFELRRAAAIQAPPERIFPLVNDLITFNSWNPFNSDPAVKGTYSGPKSGKGSAYTFSGGHNGAGRIEIVEAVPAKRVAMRLVMTEPLTADNNVLFTLEPLGNNTRVTWAMSGNPGLIGKVVHLFVNMDTMVGGQFDKGLASLKVLAEREQQKQ